MKKSTGYGEGIWLGAFLVLLISAVFLSSAIGRNRYDTVVPIHSVDIVITPEPLININIAPREEISRINGIGEVLAQRIIEWREEKGPFRSVDELLDVYGIGEAKLEMIRDRICID